MNHLRRVVGPAYLLAAILIVFTALDFTQSIWPLRIADVQWRVLAVGLASRMLIPPLLALVVAYAAALIAEQRAVLRTLAVIDGVAAILLLVALAFYSLDALQLRARLTQNNQNYDIGMAVSVVKYVLGFVILAWLALVQWRAASAMRRRGRRERSERKRSVVVRRGEKEKEDRVPPEPDNATVSPQAETLQER